jgi:hypothetical protein
MAGMGTQEPEAVVGKTIPDMPPMPVCREPAALIGRLAGKGTGTLLIRTTCGTPVLSVRDVPRDDDPKVKPASELSTGAGVNEPALEVTLGVPRLTARNLAEPVKGEDMLCDRGITEDTLSEPCALVDRGNAPKELLLGVKTSSAPSEALSV